jgi:UTP--glucose-1-phosphate uridylyltransferase
MSSEALTANVEKMRADGVPDAAVDTFRHYFELLVDGETGMLPESELEPVTDLPDAAELTEEASDELLDRAVVIKLNGGLGTSMGMTKAKSLLEVKDGLSFLDIIARQILAIREASGARLPLVLMNSFATRDESLAALARHGDLDADVPGDFVQNKEPKVRAEDLFPVEWPDDPSLEWCPPGHGDLYTALVTSGMLETLRDNGYRYAFVSNSDNLGATFDPRILAWFAGRELPFLSEVCDRTEADKKGGHVARRREGGGLVLRETAQTPDEDVAAFQDVERHPYFNCNNLWIDLDALAATLEARDNVLGLPMIVNHKTVDPGDKSSTPVIQIETAMGAAIGVFEGAGAIRVPRSRFVPVKTTSDLLVLRSDAYELTDGARVALAAEREGRAPLVDLDDDHFKLVRDFDAHLPSGPPSLVGCDRLTVEGDVTFGADVVIRGEVELSGPQRIADGAVLAGQDA